MHSTDENFDNVEVGRRLGHDLYRYRRAPSATHADGPVGEGFAEARASRVPRTTADRFVAKWLQLRCNAWRRGRAVDESVTPELVARIDVERCPVTRRRLTHGELLDSDWSVDRLNNDGAYARNNLAVMSVRANRAKGRHGFDTVLARARGQETVDELAPAEWLRMAVLMLGPCFAARPQDAPTLPLAAPIPLYSVRLAMQQVQHVFTLQAATQAGKNQLVRQFRPACPNEHSQLRLELLADTVHERLKGTECPHDAWLQVACMETLLAWRDTLDDAHWAIAGEVSRQLAGGQRVPNERLRSWRLETGGYAA